MRLLHLVGSAQLTSGGPIEGVRQVAAIMHQHGHTVDLVTLDPPDSPDLENLGMKVHTVGPPISYYKYCPKLKPWLEANHANYDVIIVNGIWQYHGWGARQIAVKYNIPYFVFTHGMLDPWFNQKYPLKRLRKMIYWPWQHRVLRDARAVLFTTEEERILARQSFSPYKVVERVIAYGTSKPPEYTEAQATAFYEAVPGAKGRHFILFLGRLHPKKGLDLLISAFAKVFGNDPNWVLVAAGPDLTGWKAKLISLATKLGVAERVLWPGMLRGDKKWGAFRKADAFLLPSHQENFGIAVAEALACATPVFISNKVNIWREVEGNDAGVVADDTLEGTIKLLESLKAMTPEQLEEMGKRAVDCFDKYFEVSQMARDILAVIDELGH